MKNLLIVAVAMLFVVPLASAEYTVVYSWEDGGTILSSYGNLSMANNVTGPQMGLTGDCDPPTWCTTGAHSPEHYLHLQESPHSGTPEAYLACVYGLQIDDVVKVSLWGWDDFDCGYTYGAPALRLYGSYGDPVDCTAYIGSAGAGTGDYTVAVPTGWQQMYSEFTFAPDPEDPQNASFAVKVRLYSYLATSEATTDYWVDSMSITIPDYCTVQLPGDPSSVEELTWSVIKGLYR